MKSTSENNLFVGQSVITPHGYGEIAKVIGGKYVVQLDYRDGGTVEVNETDIMSIEDYGHQSYLEWLSENEAESQDENNPYRDDGNNMDGLPSIGNSTDYCVFDSDVMFDSIT